MVQTEEGVVCGKDADVHAAGGLYVGSTANDPPHDDIIAHGAIYLGRNADPGGGKVAHAGVLKTYKNATEYTGYAVVPLSASLTSTDWDGDAKTTSDNGIIDLSAEFGAPAGIKGIFARMSFTDETAGVYCALGPSSTYNDALLRRVTVANGWEDTSGFVPCDENGDVYWHCSGELDYIWIQIWGYIL